ncbi:MAG TPA: enoyl-CoA hydratase/isomerase family protein [Ktedonobacteraceae bacterium]|nr:enoyl-CoA hydratase/isomerase family protein [Ktedonobacteraceae bacterium]
MTTGLELETMLCEVDGALARLRMNRPEVHNAANWAWVNDLVSATEYLAQQSEVHVVIVSGEGRSFCSGLDVKELAHGMLTPDWFATWEQGVMGLEELDAITIAAIHGYCLGGGLQVALACDLRIAATNAVMSIPAVREGVIAALGPMRLARLIGAGPAKQLCLLGHRFTPEEALALHLISEIVPPEQLETRALALAQELLETPFTALMHTKHQIDSAFEVDRGTLMAEFVEDQEECLQSPEHQAVMARYRAEQEARLRVREQQANS